MQPQLLFIHGLGSSARVFDALRAQPALRGYDIHAPDLPGFGAKYGDPAMTEPFEGASAFLIDYANSIPGPLAVVGHSMGGALGLLLSRHLQERMTAYISIEGNLIPEDCGLLSRKLAGAETDADMTAIKDYLVAFARTLTPSWQAWANDVEKVDARTLRQYAHDLVSGTDAGTHMALFERLTCPKLYVYGDGYKDQKLVSVLPTEVLRHVPESGHFTMQDQPDACAAIIADLIAPR